MQKARRSSLQSVERRTARVRLHESTGEGSAQIVIPHLFRLSGFATDAPDRVLLLRIAQGTNVLADFRGGISLRYLSEHPSAIEDGVTLTVGLTLVLVFFGLPAAEFTVTVLGDEAF